MASSKDFVGPGKSSSLRVCRRVVPSRPDGLLVGELADGLLPLPALEGLLAERLGPAAGRVAELAVEEADHRVGDVELPGVLLELLRVRAHGDEVQREVTDHLRGRGHLDDVAEDVVGGGVHVLDLLELLTEAERDRLLAQVGELAAGDLVGVDAAGRRGEPGLEGCVDAAGGLPVGLQRADGVEVEPGLPVGVVGGGDEGGERGLGRRTGHRGGRRVHRVDPGVDRGEQGRRAGRRGCRGCAGAPAGRSARAARSPGCGRRGRAAGRPCP